jgi:hypothetical protein
MLVGWRSFFLTGRFHVEMTFASMSATGSLSNTREALKAPCQSHMHARQKLMRDCGRAVPVSIYIQDAIAIVFSKNFCGGKSLYIEFVRDI